MRVEWFCNGRPFTVGKLKGILLLKLVLWTIRKLTVCCHRTCWTVVMDMLMSVSCIW
jgi:hypothetical protein